MSDPQADINQIRPEDVVIAADGGASHCLTWGIVPKVIIGDFDSLSADEFRELEQAGATLQKFPIHKDETDLELALFQALEYSPNEIIILGALGARWDMTLANLLLAAHPDFKEQLIVFKDGGQTLLIMRPGFPKQIKGSIGDIISLIPIRGDAYGITTQGLEYALADETLNFGTSRGVSNVMQAPQITIQFQKGLLLIIHNSEQ